MQFTERQIDELRTICREDGVDLTQEEMLELAHWLIARVRSIAHPIPEEDQTEFDRIVQDTRSTNT